MKEDCINCPFKSVAASKLDENSMVSLSANHVSIKMLKGEPVIKQGTYSTNVAFLRKGFAKVHITGPTSEQITRIVKAPTYLGLPTTMGVKVNQYSVTAVSDVEVCFIDIKVFMKLLNENPAFSYEIILELCKSELESYHKCANRTQKQTRGNIADMLLEFSDNIYMSNSFVLPLNQSEMGNMCDASRESISRILSEFVRDGIVAINGKSIEILNKKSLRLISQNG